MRRSRPRPLRGMRGTFASRPRRGRTMTGCDCCGVAREGGAVLSLVPKRAEADESTSWVNSLTSPDGGLAAGRFSRSIQSEIAAGQFVGAVAVVAGQNVSWTETIY